MYFLYSLGVVTFNLILIFFTKLSGIDPCKKLIDYPGGHVFMACSKLEAMAIYLVNQACGNEVLASVYHLRICPRDTCDSHLGFIVFYLKI